MEDNALEVSSGTDIAPAVEVFGRQLASYLVEMDLPSENMLVPYGPPSTSIRKS